MVLSKFPRPALFLIALVPLLSGCTSDEQLSVEEGAGVEMVDISFQPAQVTVASGEPVTWLNRDSVHHTVTADDGTFDSGSLAQGKEFQWESGAPGEYTYHCNIHPGMTGTITVE